MKNIKNILVLMTISLLGLVIFQLYWIKQAFIIKEDQFDRKVMEALSETVLKIEKQEAIQLAKKRLANFENYRLKELIQTNHQRLNIAKNKSTQNNSPKIEQNESLKNLTIKNDRLISEKNYHENQITLFREFIKQQKLIFEDLAEKEKEIYKKQEIIDRLFDKSNDIFESTYLGFQEQNNNNFSLSKKDLVKNVFSDLLKGNRPIYYRLNKPLVDTLLKQELINKGINLDFQYSIKEDQNIIFSSFGLNNNTNLEKYAIRLFPNDAIPKQHYLSIYFPDQNSFILRNIWFVLSSSFLLIMGIGLIFYRTISTIVEQKKVSEIKNDFINNMTHELKTPISTIKLAVEMINSPETNKDKISKYLTIINDENIRLENHVEKVLQIAQLDKTELLLNFEQINLHEIIENLSPPILFQIEKKEGLFSKKLEAKKPQIIADPVHIANVITNILENAIKYSIEAPYISLKTFNVDSGIVLEIADKGIGMTKDEINRIFEKFYRVPTGNLHDVKGFGLGLSYVYKIVTQHKGEIQVESKKDIGSNFKIFLPFKQNT